MDASERAARGFDADEELVLGCPVYSDSDDDSDAPPAETRIAAEVVAPPPSAKALVRLAHFQVRFHGLVGK